MYSHLKTFLSDGNIISNAINLKWNPSMEPWVKINSYGSMKHNDGGDGLVVRNSHGVVIHVESFYLLGKSIDFYEIFALKMAASYTSTKGLTRVIFELDNKFLVDYLKEIQCQFHFVISLEILNSSVHVFIPIFFNLYSGSAIEPRM
ncbi:hypothetical protein Cni_G16690 [Canna indica]|uniref:RNase H type-1 domain-containing protein n=1 Tax=Canna indica TaxID=4628 RepID=A0AAQ3KI43_9LILI|nr:hypothetical protein Cni_G16690 [Canna indica]